jgi:phosphoribosylaminoimidazole-succinocarboxamide synthase
VTAPLFQSTITSLPLLSKGKVRDIYAVDADKLLIVTTDRLSAFDVILPDPIPRKGEVLQAVANFWFEKLGHIVPNQLTGIDPETVVAENERDQVRGRAVVVKRLKPLPIEAVVRGYVIGSGWKDYQETGAICGIALPPGLKMAAKLPSPIFTPATKAEVGDHDENVSFATAQANCNRRPRRSAGRHRQERRRPGRSPHAAIRLTKKPRPTPVAAASSSPTPSSSSASTPPAPCT